MECILSFCSLANAAHSLHHLLDGQAIAAPCVAAKARGVNVAAKVRLAVVDSIEATMSFCRSAVDTRAGEQGEHLILTQVARINPRVAVPHGTGPAARCPDVAKHSFTAQPALARREVLPQLRAPVATLPPRVMAGQALIANSKLARAVTHELVRRSRQLSLAALANPVTWRPGASVWSPSHKPSHITRGRHFDGPHFELENPS